MVGTKVLCHKNDKVCDVKFEKNGYVKDVGTIYREDLLPPGVLKEKNLVIEIQRWIFNRSLAMNREDMTPLRNFYGSAAFTSENGVSLLDCYWFSDGTATWEEINAFEHFDPEMDPIYLMLNDPEELIFQETCSSPNLMVPGSEGCFWYKDQEGRLSLLYLDAQAQINKYRASNKEKEIAKREFLLIGERIYAKKEVETSLHTEWFPLESYYREYASPNASNAQNLATTCKAIGLKDFMHFFDVMYQFDEKCGVTDRELSDIGVLRDADTLQVIGFAKL